MWALPPLRGVLDELDSCLHVNLFTLPAKRQRARVKTHRDAVFLSFSFSQTSTAQLHSMKPSLHSRPPAVCVCVCVCVCVKCMWVNGSQGVAQMLYSSFSTGNKVSLFDSRLACSRLSSPEGCLPTSRFLSSSYLFLLLFSPWFLSRGSIMEGWFSSARREQISWPGRASHPTGPLTMINHIHTLSLVNRGPPHTHIHTYTTLKQQPATCTHTYKLIVLIKSNW